MNRTLFGASLIVVGLALGAALVSDALAQSTKPVVGGQRGPKVTAQLEATAVNEDGTPITDLAGYAFTLTGPQASNISAPLRVLWVYEPTALIHDVTSLYVGKTPGDYRLWAVAFDSTGRVSEPVGPVDHTWNPNEPEKRKIVLEVRVVE